MERDLLCIGGQESGRVVDYMTSDVVEFAENINWHACQSIKTQARKIIRYRCARIRGFDRVYLIPSTVPDGAELFYIRDRFEAAIKAQGAQ